VSGIWDEWSRYYADASLQRLKSSPEAIFCWMYMCVYMLPNLPDDVLSRIINSSVPLPFHNKQRPGPRPRPCSGPSTTISRPEPLRLASVLSQVNSRLREYVLNNYIRLITTIDFTKVDSNRFLNAHTLPVLARSPVLEYVSLVYCTVVADAQVMPLFSSMSVRSVSLKGSNLLTALAFRTPKPAPNLEHLDISCIRTAGVEMLFAISQFPALSSLVLSGCSNVNDAAIKAFVGQDSGPARFSIRILNLAYCDVTDDGLMLLCAQAPQLTELVLAEQVRNLWCTGACTASGITLLTSTYSAVSVRMEI
jgi:Leucine Rich repeat